MKIRIARQDLLDAVNKVKTIVAPKSALPILSHVLLESGETSLRLTATDLKVSIECEVDCAVEEPGSLTVSAQRLSNMLAELPEQEIVMELGDNNVINIACGRIQSKLFSMAPDEFPPMRSFEGVEPLTLPQGMLRNLLSKTSFAICSDQARYNLTGLLFQLQGGALTVVATDGRRMTLYMKSGGVPETSDVKVIIPGKMIHELERLLADSDEEVKVYLDETQAAFEFNSIRLVTALIEGNFPNYEMVVPKKHDKEGQVERGPFVEAIRRTRTMTNDKFNSVRFQIGTGNMILKVVTPEVGEYVEEMPIEYEGETVEIAFNPDFMLDVLRHIESDKVLLQFRDGTSPGVLKPAGEDETDQYVNVIMPIRI